MNGEWWDLDLVGVASAIRDGEVTAEHVAKLSLERLQSYGRRLNAVMHLDAEAALEAARAADAARASGAALGPLHGVPLSIKDLFDLRGTATTAASNVRRDHRAQRDAVTVARLREAGAILIG